MYLILNITSETGDSPYILSNCMQPNSTPNHNLDPDQMSSNPPPSLFLHRAFDTYIMREFPELNFQPPSQDDIRRGLYAHGATEETLEEVMNEQNATRERILDRLPGRKFKVTGRKPLPDDASVSYFLIPNSNLALRVWSGGLESVKQMFFDFFDRTLRVAVNTPEGYEVYNVNNPSGLAPYGRLLSWERTEDRNRIPRPGFEKYSALEGSRIMIRRPCEEPCFFRIPTRPTAGENNLQLLSVLP